MPPFTFIIDRPSLVGEAVMQILLEREYDFDVRRTLTQGLVVTVHSPRSTV